MDFESLAQAIQASGFGAWARGSLPYPIANLVHLAGLVLLVGGIGLLDLRLLGLFRSLPLPALSRVLTPFGIVGLALMLMSGPVMFAADAASLWKVDLFRLKLLLVLFAVGNAVLFRFLWRGRMATWDAKPPATGRVMAAASLALWPIIGGLGRFVAYV